MGDSKHEVIEEKIQEEDPDALVNDDDLSVYVDDDGEDSEYSQEMEDSIEDISAAVTSG